MLLNISNHPSAAWSINQKQTAETLYGSVIDMPFPNIPSQYSTKEVATLVAEYKEKVLVLAPQAVHLMGEMTFTCALVRAIQKEGITCIASTSERTVVDEGDGKKTVIFNFVRFREYCD